MHRPFIEFILFDTFGMLIDAFKPRLQTVNLVTKLQHLMQLFIRHNRHNLKKFAKCFY